MRKLNLFFVLSLVMVLTVLGVGIHFVHAYQVRRNASDLKERARRAEADKDLEKAADALKRYLSIKRQDGPAWAWYARVMDELIPEGRGRKQVYQVYLVHEEALQYDA